MNNISSCTRKTLLVMAVILISANSFAQIPTMDVAPKQAPKPVITPYDSTKNHLGHKDNIFSYVGQELFVLPKRESAQKYGYSHFRTMDFTTTSSVYSYTFVYHQREAGTTSSTYESVANKTFIVDNVEQHENSTDLYVFTLHDKEFPENQCKYVYEIYSTYDFPFVTMGFYSYLNKKYQGKEIVCENDEVAESDVITGEPIKFDSIYTKWNCTGVTIETEYYNLVLGLESKDKTQHTYVNVDRIDRIQKRIFSVSEWNSMVKKYGATYVKLMMQTKICVGMPKKLLIMSWGEPERINDNSYGSSQYVYDGQYVYLKDGKITGWN